MQESITNLKFCQSPKTEIIIAIFFLSQVGYFVCRSSITPLLYFNNNPNDPDGDMTRTRHQQRIQKGRETATPLRKTKHKRNWYAVFQLRLLRRAPVWMRGLSFWCGPPSRFSGLLAGTESINHGHQSIPPKRWWPPH